MKRTHLRAAAIAGILLLVCATGVIAEAAGPFAFFANLPVVVLIAMLVRLFVKA